MVLTTAPNDTIIHVHDRMPVLLTDDEVTPWPMIPEWHLRS